MAMIELQNDQLRISFPEIHEDAVCHINFQRTLRIPDDNQQYPLPPGLGRFRLHHVDDYADALPEQWRAHGGVFLPMHQAEALWINFTANYPMAVKVAAGKIDAITGEPWCNELSATPQNYVAIPDQPWLDGFSVGEGLIRQFIAMPLGEGHTAEEQLTGDAEHGGIQLAVYPLKRSIYLERQQKASRQSNILFSRRAAVCESPSMGLAPGGLMRQKIYKDRSGIDSWDQTVRARCFVHLLNSRQYMAVTGAKPPSPPPTAKQYAAAGLPWFDYYNDDLKPLPGAKVLAGLDSLASSLFKKGKPALEDNQPVTIAHVEHIKGKSDIVRDGNF
jgi:hypothetical protein